MTSNKCAKNGVNMFYSYMVYTYSERGHSGLQDYVLFEKSNFLRKIDFRRGGSPLSKTPIFITSLRKENEYYFSAPNGVD